MTLVLVAHGTRRPAGQAQIHHLARQVTRRRPATDVRLAYVDVQAPHIRDLAGRLTGRSVVVPLLLTAGHHVRVDIAEAVADVDAVVTPPIGADGRLLGILTEHLAAAGPADAVVLAAAGSSDPRSRASVAAVAAALPVPAVVGYASAAPYVPDAVRTLRQAGAERILVLAYLLVDGRFHRSLGDCGADLVTPPLAAHPGIVEVVLDLCATRV